jgi:O-antigen ligase
MPAMLHASRGDPARGVGWVVAGCSVLMGATAWLDPPLLPDLIGALLALGGVVFAWRHLTASWLAWLLVAGLSLEMTLNDLIGPAAFQATIAVVKSGELGLVVLTIIRFGLLPDRFNPILGFVWIAVAGLVTGLHPDLTRLDMLRSLLGSVTPFLVFFCVKPAGWGPSVRTAVTFIPVLSVVLGSALDFAGLRPVLVDGGGLRLAGLGHPAFLAGVCLPAIYAGLLRWLRTGSGRTALLLAVNLAILFLTGARAPAAYAAFVIAASLLLASDAAVPRAHRLVLLAAGIVTVPVLLLIGETYSSLRLFEILADGDAGHLSGRDLLWPAFEAAAAQAPWFGWGLGAGNFVIPHGSQLAVLLGTWAAHNEYLRIQVEGGYVGRTLLIALFVLWTVSHTRRLPRLERLVMRLIFVAFAGHAATDNVLISTPVCVFFAFVAAVYSEADATASNRLRDKPHVA